MNTLPQQPGTNQQPAPLPTYRVKIRRERFRGSDSFVARDANNDWRAYGDAVNTPMTPQDVAEYLFHREEIAAVGVDTVTGEVFADIIEWGKVKKAAERPAG
jgi:hypothetical protein